VCADCAAAWREYQRANRSKWKREPRVPLHIQLADECVLADRLARALTRVVCQDCQHAACESARLVVFDWMAKRGSNG
jgi:Fe-S-cluster-containing dehydrogenase component